MLDSYFFTKVSHRLTIGKKSNGGRNFLGRICVHHKGSGNKRNYRLIDFCKRINNFGVILQVFKDSYRTGFIALVIYENGLASYMLLSEGAFGGLRFYSGSKFPIVSEKSQKLGYIFNIGSSMPLKYLKLFTKLNSIELYPSSGAKLCRAAGVGALFSAKLDNKCVLKLNSGWQLFVSIDCIASIGIVSNYLHQYDRLLKAGVNRWKGIRPTVRGIVKNPCDHPHGGGEGKNSPPAAQVSPWGKLTKGTPTKNKKVDRLKRRLYKNVI